MTRGEHALVDAAWALAGERTRTLEGDRLRRLGIVPTPPPLARFVARWLLARVGPDATFVDPAVGTGVFPAALIDAGARGRIVGFDVDGEVLASLRPLLGPRVTLLHENPLASLEHAALDGGPPLVVLGNPPWAGKSESRGLSASDGLLATFDRDEHGAPLGEKKKGVLSDDYVRFTAWALAVIGRRRSGGALGFVTNASFVDGPVHRGMRRVLAEALDPLLVIDLGGSSLVAREAGRADANLFGVRPGAAIVLGVARRAEGPRRVRYTRLRGTAPEKLAALEALADDELPNLEPRGPSFSFVPAPALPAWWHAAPSLGEWLPFHREGVQTNRDALVTDRDRGALERRIAAIARGEVPLPARAHFDPDGARRALVRESVAPSLLAYRPFEDRWLYPGPSLCHRPRPELAAAAQKSTLVLVAAAKDRGERPFFHLALTRHVPDNCLLSPRSSCRARGFPSHGPDGGENLGERVRAALVHHLGRAPEMDEVLLWLAAHLGAPAWTTPIDEALKREMPRVPLPESAGDFARKVAAARALAAAFLGPPGGEGEARVVVGHHLVRSDALARAREGLDAIHRGAA